MNTPLEELIKKAWDEAQKINISKGRVSGVNASEALDWMADQYIKLLIKGSLRTEEIAIGFSIWTEKNGWDWSGNHQVFINDKFEPKEGSKLFKDYMESLKP